MTTENVVDNTINTNPITKPLYANLIKALRTLGPIVVEPKKTSVHIKPKSGFAGVHPRKDHLIFQVVSERPIESKRIVKVDQASASRFHNHVKITSEQDVDKELLEWCNRAYTLMG